MIRALIVNPAVLERHTISKAIETDNDIQVVGTASSASIALQKIAQLQPDVVVMDIDLPDMEGTDFLRQIRRRWPAIAVLVLASPSVGTFQKRQRTQSLGVIDYIEKPTDNNTIEQKEKIIGTLLLAAIHKYFDHLHENLPVLARSSANPPPLQRKIGTKVTEIVAIGSSTGGPRALTELMPSFPANFSVPIVIVQHMPPQFTLELARRLNDISAIEVYEASEGDILRPGAAWLAPGGYHMVLNRRRDFAVEILLNEDPPEEGCRPAVDVLFRSVASLYGSDVLSVILTGMGKDGLLGSKRILENGGTLFAQDKESSVVWGMPGAVTNAGLPEKVLPIKQMGPEIIKRVQQSTNRASSRVA